LAFDYAGALVGSVTFSLLLMPTVGLVRASVALGVLNVVAASFVLRSFGRALPGARIRIASTAAVGGLLVALWCSAAWFEELTESAL
ncbi:MAG: hypothetical protein MUF54_18020, partial [Polyangiaceae bacterium]|nr:hypothetical protein [Polyangiaceae bacterium]